MQEEDTTSLNIENESGFVNVIDKVVPNLIGIFDWLLLNDREPKVKSSHYPSGARILTSQGPLGSCIRQQFYSWKGEVEQVEEDVSGLWKMDMGNAIHEWVADKLRKRFSVYEEYPIVYHPDFMTYPIRGRIDNLVISEEFGAFGVEVKSAYGAGITNRHSGVKYNGPKLEHLLQALIYLYVSRHSQEEKDKYMPVSEEDKRELPLPNLEFFVLYYLARDNGYRTQFYIDLINGKELADKFRDILSPERLEVIENIEWVPVATDGINTYIYEYISFREIVKSFRVLEKYLENDDTPPREYKLAFTVGEDGFINFIDKKQSDWNCSYCRYRQICHVRDKEI